MWAHPRPPGRSCLCSVTEQECIEVEGTAPWASLRPPGIRTAASSTLPIAPSLSPKPQSWPPGRGRHSQAPQKGGGSSDFQALPRPAPCFLVVGIGNSVPLLPLLPLPSRLVQGGLQPPSALVLSWVGTDKLCWDAVGSSSLQPLSSSDRCQPAASPSSTPSAVGFSQGPEGFTLSHPLACEHVFLRSGVSKLFSEKGQGSLFDSLLL